MKHLLLTIAVFFSQQQLFSGLADEIASAQTAPAEESADVLPPATKAEIVVTASALEEPVSITPAAVTIIDAEEIEQRAARDVADVLREVPGVVLARSGSPGKATSLFMRGASSQHTLVLWNGIELNNPYFSGYDWGLQSTSGVQRIEVVRGPYSALYGSDAVSGVVNILTAPLVSSATAELQAGERGLLGGRFNGAYVSGNLTAAASVESRQDDGWHENDDLDQQNATASLEWAFSRAFAAGVQARWQDYELGIPFNEVFGTPQLVPSLERRQSGEELQVSIPVRGQIGRASYEISASRAEHAITLSDPEDPFGLTEQATESMTDRASALLRIRTRIGTFVGGAEREVAEVDDASNFGSNLEDRERRADGLFLENRHSLTLSNGSLELALGARHDDFDEFGSRTSPRLSAAWIRGAHKVRAGFGESFRAPSIGELFFPFAGNLELEPEESRSAELGYDFGSGSLIASATLFAADFENLIVFDNASFRFENVGEASSRGLELGLGGRLAGSWSAGLAYTYVRTEDERSGLQLLRRPEHSGSAHVAFRGAVWSGSLVVVHAGARSDVLPVFPYTRTENDPYTTADLVVGYDTGAFEPYVKLENVSNEEYDEVLGFPAPGRRALLGIRYRLQ